MSAWRAQLHAVQVVDGTTCCAAGAHVASLAQGLAARGVDVTVCAPLAAERTFGFSKAGARFRTVEMGEPGNPRNEAAAIGVLRYVCSTADVVHAHGVRAGILAAIALRSTGPVRHRAPLVVTLHGCASPQHRTPPVTKYSGPSGIPRPWWLPAVPVTRLLSMVERYVARAADVVLGASSSMVHRARRLGARDARLAPVAAPRAMVPSDPEQVRAKTRAELGVPDDGGRPRPLLLSVGRLSASPSHRTLLDAARAWRSLDPEPLLLVAGDGPERALLQDRIDSERLPARLLGVRHDIPALLVACDLVILPSRWEGRSLIAQGALRAGVPLVAAAAGTLPELVGDGAALVPYGNAEALAKTVALLITDPRSYAALVERGKAQAETWPEEDDTLAQVLSIYDELVQRPRR